MRPFKGRTLSRPDNIRELYHDAVERGLWSIQPKLGGDRADLAVVDKKVYIQNRHGGWLRQKVRNAPDFLRLPNRTCFDGEVFKGNFYPFECLASNSNPFLSAEVHERVALAKDMMGFLKQPWLFDPPTLAWLLNRAKNAPIFEGVVLKQVRSRYVLLGSATQTSSAWMKRLW